jgi:ABC-type glycerol-3-phosphate transport system substrate-binding protein
MPVNARKLVISALLGLTFTACGSQTPSGPHATVTTTSTVAQPPVSVINEMTAELEASGLDGDQIDCVLSKLDLSDYTDPESVETAEIAQAFDDCGVVLRSNTD